jgi:hypothetical protein
MTTPLQRALLRAALGLILAFTGFASPAFATRRAPEQPTVVPELDPGLVVSGLAIATGGVLILSDRWLRKRTGK